MAFEPRTCWTTDDIDVAVCKTNSQKNDWCYAANASFYYSITPPKFAVNQTALTHDNFTSLKATVQSAVQIATRAALNVSNPNGTCWSSQPQPFWLPYDLIQVVANRSRLTFDSWTTTPLPRDFLRAAETTGTDVLFLKTVQGSSSIGYLFNDTDGDRAFLPTPRDFALEPQECLTEFAPDEQQFVSYTQQFVEPEITACRFVCVQVFYGGSLDWAPPSVGLYTGNDCTHIHHIRVNVRALRPMLLLNDYQRYADNVELNRTYQVTPWENFSRPEHALNETTCKIVAETYCGIKATGYPEASLYEPEMHGVQNYSSLFGHPKLPMVIPDVIFSQSLESITVTPEIRRRYRAIFWHVMLTYTDQDSCTGNHTVHLSDTLQATVSLVWHTTLDNHICVGIPGCSDFDTHPENCAAAPGCTTNGPVTSPPTPTLAPIPLGTLQPIAPPPTVGLPSVTGHDKDGHEAAVAAASVAAFLVFTLACLAFLFHRAEDEQTTAQMFLLE